MAAIFPDKVILFFACLYLTSVGHSQEVPEVSYISNEQGLSNNFVSCIYQDHLGIMWFGTFDGLNRYDGYTFKVFRPQFNNSGSIIYTWISCIAEDGHQNLWVGTRRGISIFDDVTSSFRPVYYHNSKQNNLQLLQANIEKLNRQSALDALKSEFGIEADDMVEDATAPTVFGASLVNFPRRLRTKTRGWPKYAPISSFRVV